MTRNSRRVRFVTALLALACSTSVGMAQLANDTLQLDPTGTQPLDLYWQTVPAATEALGHGWVQEIPTAIARGADLDVEQLDKAVAGIRQTAQKLPPALRDELLREADKLAAESRDAANQSSWLNKLGHFLDVVEVVSTASKAAGYLAEGDATGASAVVAKDLTKKLAEVAGAMGMSWVPGGPVLGAGVGEALHSKYVAPVIDANEDTLRMQEFKAKYLKKPWIPMVEVWRADGSIGVLDADMYVDKDTSTIRRRSPEEQARYEAALHVEWQDARVLLGLLDDLAAGKISREAYDQLLRDYINRDRTQPWDRAKAATHSDSRAPEDQILAGILALPHDKLLIALETLGVKPSEDFYNCLCRAASYGSSGTQQYYHPDTIGDYDARYSCQTPGDPCIVSGYGCMRYPLPSDAAIWKGCSAPSAGGAGEPLTDAIASAMAKRAAAAAAKTGGTNP
ncbi:MAG: hypothetical protein WCC57_16040 [Paracoccaceae bacterium]